MRAAIFVVGVILMALGLAVYFGVADDTRFYRGTVFNLGLAISITAIGWPAEFT